MKYAIDIRWLSSGSPIISSVCVIFTACTLARPARRQGETGRLWLLRLCKYFLCTCRPAEMHKHKCRRRQTSSHPLDILECVHFRRMPLAVQLLMQFYAKTDTAKGQWGCGGVGGWSLVTLNFRILWENAISRSSHNCRRITIIIYLLRVAWRLQLII